MISWLPQSTRNALEIIAIGVRFFKQSPRNIVLFSMATFSLCAVFWVLFFIENFAVGFSWKTIFTFGLAGHFLHALFLFVLYFIFMIYYVFLFRRFTLILLAMTNQGRAGILTLSFPMLATVRELVKYAMIACCEDVIWLITILTGPRIFAIIQDMCDGANERTFTKYFPPLTALLYPLMVENSQRSFKENRTLSQQMLQSKFSANAFERYNFALIYTLYGALDIVLFYELATHNILLIKDAFVLAVFAAILFYTFINFFILYFEVSVYLYCKEDYKGLYSPDLIRRMFNPNL